MPKTEKKAAKMKVAKDLSPKFKGPVNETQNFPVRGSRIHTERVKIPFREGRFYAHRKRPLKRSLRERRKYQIPPCKALVAVKAKADSCS